MAICGVAGTTETGNVDPLDAMADIAREFGAHFHVDAAWGGPTLFSRTYKHLLRGIEKADSVTFDAHKQLYVPMGVASWYSATRAWPVPLNTTPSTSSVRAPGILAAPPWKAHGPACPC